MKKFRVFVRGENFLINLDGVNQKLAFYTTRFVEAEDEEAAEYAVMDLQRNDPKLVKAVLNEQSDPPMMYAEEIEELDSTEAFPGPAPGFAFYEEGSESSLRNSLSITPMRYLLSSTVFILLAYILTLAQGPVPRFRDYPAKVIRTNKPVKVKIHSTPDTVCFRSMLRQTARRGERFAGHYALSWWGCGTECARLGIVDLITGRAYVSRFSVTGVGIKTRLDSRLVLVNDPRVVDKNFGDPPPLRYAPVYFVWTGRQLLPVEGRRIGREWPREFLQCGRT